MTERFAEGGKSAPLTPEQIRDQRIVLTHVISRQPDEMSLPELVHEIEELPEAREQKIDVEDAVASLTEVGLFHHVDDVVKPSVAALAFQRIADANGWSFGRET